MAIVAAVLIGFGCAAAVEPPDPSEFYTIEASQITGSPGDIIRAEPFGPGPAGASAYRILYVSTGLKYEPIVVSGIVVVPEGFAPEVGRPVVAWAHPTTGVATRCAPSLLTTDFNSIKGLSEMLARGFVVVATDYPGLGTPGTHPYLVGESAARSVLDSVRAAGNLPEAKAGKKYAVWGHSQGGQASLFTGQIATSYAPELRLAGVAAAAPATELASLFKDDVGTGIGNILTAYTLWSWNRVYKAPLAPVLDASAAPVVDAIAADCIENIEQGFVISQEEKKISTNFLHGDVTETEPWKSLLLRNSTGKQPIRVPVFLAQGTDDKIVNPQVTFKYAEALCKGRTAVHYEWLPGVGHHTSGQVAAHSAVQWIEALFQGLEAPNECRKLPKEPKPPEEKPSG